MILTVMATAVFAQPPLRIIAPGNGAIIHSGTTLTVTVRREPSVSRDLVFLSIDGRFGRIEELVKQGPGPLYEFEIKIPSDAESRIYTLVAANAFLAADVNGAESPGVPVDIERPDNPGLLRETLGWLALKPGEVWPLSITGKFADGEEVELTRSTRTEYMSNRRSVASVSKEGVVTAHQPGEARITARNGKAVTVVRISVDDQNKPPVFVLGK